MVLEASSDASYLARGGHVSTDDLLAPAAGALRRERAEIVESLPHDIEALTAVVTVPLKRRRRALGTLVFESVRVDAETRLDLLARIDERGDSWPPRSKCATARGVLMLAPRARKHIQFDQDLVAVSDRRGRIGAPTWHWLNGSARRAPSSSIGR